MPREIKQFEVSIKAFIVRDGALLMMQNPKSGTWELPGGRIDVGEEGLPAEEILTRELTEELGPNLKVQIIGPVTTWVIPWKVPRLGQHVFAIGLLCQYVSGEVQISDEHQNYRWIRPEHVNELDLVPGYSGALDYFWKTR